MPLSHSDLTFEQKEFVARATVGIWNLGQSEIKPISILGDGSASPNGEKFAAVLEGASYRCVFDFGTGLCYHTAVQLPIPIGG